MAFIRGSVVPTLRLSSTLPNYYSLEVPLISGSVERKHAVNKMGRLCHIPKICLDTIIFSRWGGYATTPTYALVESNFPCGAAMPLLSRYALLQIVSPRGAAMPPPRNMPRPRRSVTSQPIQHSGEQHSSNLCHRVFLQVRSVAG